ncbi:hypothetical protein ACJ73_01169 [Blastomyces percursus]|uniref:Uncharacterized protein n=1 Tax=Blastomyces percursus TaxID=1658174 RepID=A0A1J9QG18_9EURO|nr:hypothetical protein ACJ73_01169 [Blastomyces percursus]
MDNPQNERKSLDLKPKNTGDSIRHGSSSSADSTAYMRMLLELDSIPWSHNFCAGLSNWKSDAVRGRLDGPGVEEAILNTIQNPPLLFMGVLLFSVGSSGFLNSLAGLITTLINIYTAKSGDWSVMAILTHPHFPDENVKCLHGRHRINVGRKVLPPTDRWWTVDLYLDDIGEQLRTTLEEEYCNENGPGDGEIYCKIRQYQEEGNAQSEKRWWARLSSSSKGDRLRQLSNVELRTAFNAVLLPIPG